MSNWPKLLTILAIIALLAVGINTRRRQLATLESLRSLASSIEALNARIASLEESLAKRPAEPAAAVSTSNPTATATDLAKLKADITSLKDRITRVESSNTPTNRPEPALVYNDSKRRSTYSNAGNASPEAGLETTLFAISKLDPKLFLESLTGDWAESFSKDLAELPPGVMPGGFRNGALYKAAGFKILERTEVSADETKLKVFLEGVNMNIHVTLRRVGNDWKFASLN